MTQRFVTTSVRGSLYDYPKYYDLVFGVGSSAECNFLEGCFGQHARRRVRRLFEPACGSGRLLVRFADRGFKVSGYDLNRAMVDYCNARLKRRGLAPAAVFGDMVDASLRSKVDAAFNMICSFQLLSTEHTAEKHLRSMAANIASGGVYVLGLHLMPSRGARIQSEQWAATRGRLSVVSRVWTKQIRSGQREERCGMISDIRTPRARVRITEELRFRTYSASQIARLFAKVAQFEPVATYDFTYDLLNPISVSPETQDVVYVLRRQ